MDRDLQSPSKIPACSRQAMAPIANEPEISGNPQTGTGGKAQPAVMEIPVSVNGARTVEGSDKREPFSESTQTVLVFANGAVIRLSTVVRSGQLLFLTNEKTKREVVCQVVKSKPAEGANGYVELEFTEPAEGFWGMRVPAAPVGGSLASQANPASNAAGPANASTSSLQEKLGEGRSTPAVTPAAVPPIAAKADEGKSNGNGERRSLTKLLTERNEEPKEKKATPVVAVPKARVQSGPDAVEVSNKMTLPTLTEFLTRDDKNGNSKSVEKKNPSETQKSAASGRADEAKEAAPETRNTLSAALFTPKPNGEGGKSGTAAALPPEATENPAPGSYSFDFETDEVKIPAWLEPLARNSATAPSEAKPAQSKGPATKLTESKIAEAPAAAVAVIANEVAASGDDEVETVKAEEREPVLTLSPTGPTPNFGSTLALDERAPRAKPRGEKSASNIGLWLTAVALLLASGAGWYWYSNQPKAAASEAPRTSAEVVPAPEVSKPQPDAPARADASRNPWPETSSPNREAPRPGNATLTKPSPTTSSSNESTEPAADPQPEPAKKPSIGHVHFSAPVVKSKRAAADGNETEPDPGLSGVAGGDAGALNLMAGKSKQPSAPVPVGGEVKAARLLSSVPPVYPQLARTQRLSGDVVIDALIDSNGRVAGMKVLSGSMVLHEAAMDAVRQWKYQPATLNGQATAMHLTVTVQFRLQ